MSLNETLRDLPLGIKIHVLSLEEAALALYNEDELRNAELRNIRSIIQGAALALVDGDFREADEMCRIVTDRLNTLAADESSAGAHEQYR